MKDEIKRYKRFLEICDMKYARDRKVAFQDIRYTLDELSAIATSLHAGKNDGIALDYAWASPSFKRKWKSFFVEFLIIQIQSE